MIYSPAISLVRPVVTFSLPCVHLLLTRTPASSTLLLLFWKPRAASFVKAGLSKQQIYLCLKIKVFGSRSWQLLTYFQGSLVCSLLFPLRGDGGGGWRGCLPALGLIFNPACAWGGQDGGSALLPTACHAAVDFAAVSFRLWASGQCSPGPSGFVLLWISTCGSPTQHCWMKQWAQHQNRVNIWAAEGPRLPPWAHGNPFWSCPPHCGLQALCPRGPISEPADPPGGNTRAEPSRCVCWVFGRNILGWRHRGMNGDWCTFPLLYQSSPVCPWGNQRVSQQTLSKSKLLPPDSQPASQASFSCYFYLHT